MAFCQDLFSRRRWNRTCVSVELKIITNEPVSTSTLKDMKDARKGPFCHNNVHNVIYKLCDVLTHSNDIGET